MTNQLLARQEIQAQRKVIDTANQIIDRVAKSQIPDFHFLSWRVSTFWECDKSPIGMCVFQAECVGGEPECRYCGDPEERK